MILRCLWSKRFYDPCSCVSTRTTIHCMNTFMTQCTSGFTPQHVYPVMHRQLLVRVISPGRLCRYDTDTAKHLHSTGSTLVFHRCKKWIHLLDIPISKPVHKKAVLICAMRFQKQMFSEQMICAGESYSFINNRVGEGKD